MKVLPKPSLERHNAGPGMWNNVVRKNKWARHYTSIWRETRHKCLSLYYAKCSEDRAYMRGKKAKTVCDRDDIKGNGCSFFQFPHVSREGFMDMTARESRLPLVMSLTKGRKRRGGWGVWLKEKPRERQRNFDDALYFLWILFSPTMMSII